MDKEDDLFIKYPGYKKLYECFMELARNDAQKDAIEQIMKNGEYNGFKLNSMLSNKKDSQVVERNRRIDFAEMILFDENLFYNLANNGLNVFHGTKIDALETILSKGLFSSSELNEKEIELKTGEEYAMRNNPKYSEYDYKNNLPKRGFISLTDDFTTSAQYADFRYEELDEYSINRGKIIRRDKNIPIILCFNGTDIKQEHGKSLVNVKSDCNEIGVTESINSSDIKCIITSYDKMDYVKSLASKYGIDVLGYDFNNKFEKRLIDKKGKFYDKLNYDIKIDEQEFESSKEIIKETLKESNNRNNDVPKRKLLGEDLSMKLASNVKWDIVNDLTNKYNKENSFIPVTADELIDKYNMNENVAQRLALEIDQLLEGYIQDKVVRVKRKNIGDKTKDIPSSVETTYNELKQEEIKFFGIAKKLGLDYSITRTDDTDIYTKIDEIKRNMENISRQIQRVGNPEKLDKVGGVLQELEQMTQDGTIKTEHIAELKETFEKSFDSKVQDLIRNSKLSRLEQEKGQVESEKVSLIGRILGKGKLKQAKLNNIDLKMQLLKQKYGNDKNEYSLEDSLSDLYTYSQCELDRNLTPEMQEFLSVVKTDPKLWQMIDQQQLKQQFNDKVNNRQTEVQLVPIDNDRKISNRYMANMLQLQNNEMSKQIQNNRATTIARQNDLSFVSINENSALNRFQNMVNKINLSTQTIETRQQQRAEQENEMQI